MLQNANAAVQAVYSSDWGRIVATLIRSFGDFDLAEEAAQEAFAAAVDQWRDSGVPDSPPAWIIQTARHKAIDRLRRQTRFKEKVESYAASGLIQTIQEPVDITFDGKNEIPDDRLRLIFTCCHPALAPEAQVALTLRTLGRSCHRGDRARVSGPGHDDGAAARAGQAQDSRRRHSLFSS